MRDRLGAACLGVAAGLAILLAFATPSAIADPPAFDPISDQTLEATSAAGAVATFSATATDDNGAPTISCDHNSGDTFPLGVTTVTCTATDTTTSEFTTLPLFTITVQDTTAPVVSPVSDPPPAEATSSAGANVSYSTPTATDAVAGSPAVSCSPGNPYPIGTTLVTCSATDGSGNTGSTTLHVTVQDTTPPAFTSVPSNITGLEATGPGGAVASFTVAANDLADPAPAVGCSPASGSMFALGTTPVSCTATDASGNHASAGFSVTVVDTQAPTLSNPGNQGAEATGPGGAPVSFTVTASDAVSGNPPVSCNPSSGSTFALGSTTVNCSAQDGAGLTGQVSFTVNVVDTTPPAFSNVPALPVFEANTAAGTTLGYTTPTAFDLVSGAIPVVVCSPPPNSGFPIGTTTVNCTARDTANNLGTITFPVTVADRTPPVISAPPSLSLYATTPTGIPATDPSVANASRFITASDSIDPHPVITSDMPSFLPLGHTLVHFFATDKYGNRAGVNMDVLVIAPPTTGSVPPLANPDVEPPDNVSNLSARLGNGAVTLTWTRPRAADFDHVVIYRGDPTSASLGDAVYTGPATKVTDRGVSNGTQYRYVVVSYDKAGNRSVGLAILAMPQPVKLTRPLDGAVVKAPPLLIWLAISGADYYNVQLFRETAKTLSASYLSSARKILSAWPKRNRLVLKKSWKFQGRTYRLTPGTYRWFVWPGFGTRASEKYGPLVGQSTFVVKR